VSPQNSGVPDGYSADQVRTMLEELRTIAALEVRWVADEGFCLGFMVRLGSGSGFVRAGRCRWATTHHRCARGARRRLMRGLGWVSKLRSGLSMPWTAARGVRRLAQATTAACGRKHSFRHRASGIMRQCS